MDYVIDSNVPMPPRGWGRRENAISATVRKMEVGQSVLIAYGDPNWSDRLVPNLNMSDKPKHFVTQREANGIRIFRDE